MAPGIAGAMRGGLVSEKLVGLDQLSLQQISYGEMITNDLANAEQRVQQLRRIQELLAKNPEFEELLTLVGRVGRY